MIGSGILVRPAVREDAAAVAAMAKSLQTDANPSKFTARSYLEDGFGDEPAFRALIAEIEGAPRGYAFYYWGYDTDSATRGVYLSDLFVDANYRRRGGGRALVSGLARKTRAEGARWMFWSVVKRNRAARRFYRKLVPELRNVIVCAAFGSEFDRIADLGA